MLAHRRIFEFAPDRYSQGLKFFEVIDLLANVGAFGAEPDLSLITTIYHNLRKAGNAAVHKYKGDQSEALMQLKTARNIGKHHLFTNIMSLATERIENRNAT